MNFYFNKIILFGVFIFFSGCYSYKNCDYFPSSIIPYKLGESKPKKDKKIVLVGGCFDVLHIGHIRFLKAAKNAGDYLIIALEPDSRITQSKKRIPVHNQMLRAEILSHLSFVDEILLLPKLNGFEDYLQLVKDVNPDIIALTENDMQQLNKQKQAQSVGATLIILKQIDNSSSSLILKQLQIKASD